MASAETCAHVTGARVHRRKDDFESRRGSRQVFVGQKTIGDTRQAGLVLRSKQLGTELGTARDARLAVAAGGRCDSGGSSVLAKVEKEWHH